jgi:hypothetical protein
MPKFLVLSTTLLIVYTIHAQHRVQHAFTLADNPSIIEGMSYDPVSKLFYFGESTMKRMLIYTLSGKRAGYIDAAKDGMTSVLGSIVDTNKRHLLICGAIDTGSKKRMCVFRYDLNNGKLISKLPDTSGKAKLFNDVTITSDGSVYVTDTYVKTIYTTDAADKVMTEYLQSDLLRDANGITSNGDTLYVSTSRGIVRINTKSKEITALPLDNFMIAGIDGLYYYKNSLIGIQNVFFPVTIVRYFLDNKQNRLSSAQVLSSGHPSFVIPTTGAIAGNQFYFMSNNNIGKEEILKKNTRKTSVLMPVSIEKLRLTD